MATAGTAASPAPIPLRARTDKSLNFAATQPGIVYTCDPGIDADVCTTLNTTISGLYASIFTNAAANIYVKFGPT